MCVSVEGLRPIQGETSSMVWDLGVYSTGWSLGASWLNSGACN